MSNKKIIELKENATKYQNVKSEELIQAFKDNHIYFPDFIHKFILLNVLRKYVFDEEKLSIYTDEFKYQLNSYNFFSIYLLEKMIIDYDYKVLSSEYKNLFMRFFLKNQKKFKSTIALEKTLENLEEKQLAKEEDFNTCLSSFHQIYYTPKGYLDGIPLSILKEAIVETYNIPSLKGLAAKYNVELPRRASKQQLIDLISERFILSQDEKSLIENMTITDLCKYSKQKGLKISSDLKKADMVEFIIYTLHKYHEDVEKDLYNYDILLEDEENNTQENESMIERSEDSLPTSSVFVDAPLKETEFEKVEEEPIEDTPALEEVKEEEPKEVEPVEIQEEVPVEEVKEEEAPEEQAEEVEEEPIEDTPVIETPKEEPKEELQELDKDEEKNPVDYYDDSVDQEIRSIIKKYYQKKQRKDALARWIVSIIVIAVVAVVAYFVLKFLNVL